MKRYDLIRVVRPKESEVVHITQVGTNMTTGDIAHQAGTGVQWVRDRDHALIAHHASWNRVVYYAYPHQSEDTGTSAPDMVALRRLASTISYMEAEAEDKANRARQSCAEVSYNRYTERGIAYGEVLKLVIREMQGIRGVDAMRPEDV